jgi:uncharacterized protein YceH (UPF0502 family)
MPVQLTATEARVIGCLLEKERTTPEQYPLSLNALTNACNQKSSRDPVMDLSESTVQETLDALVKRRLVMNKSGFGSRVTKYQHRFCNTEFGALNLSDEEVSILCVLLLRGPQTPGELRTRTERLHKFSDVHEVEAALERLMQREDGPFVTNLPREPGKREARYAHLFSGGVQSDESDRPAATPALASGSTSERIQQLEATVAALQSEVDQLKERIDRISGE